MSKWKMVKLQDTCDVRDGTHDSPKYIERGYPLVTSKNLSEGYIDITNVNYISKEDYEKINMRSNVDDGDILMPMIGTIGNPIIVNKTFDFAIKNVALIKFLNSNIYNAYINYALKSSIFKMYIKKENRGGTQKFISLGNIRKFEIPLAPLEVQKHIAETLDKVTEIINLHKKRLEELDNLVKAIFHEIFGDPVKNEKAWDLISLWKLGTWASGGTPARKIGEYFEGEINWFSAGELNSMYLLESNEKITEKAINESSAKLFKKGSLLIGMYDTAAFKMGILTKDSASNQACTNVNLNNEICKVEWLYFNLMLMKEYFLSQRRGVRQKNLNLGMIKEFIIPLPPIELQNKFAQIAIKIEEQKTLEKQAISESENLFNSLMSKYFD